MNTLPTIERLKELRAGIVHAGLVPTSWADFGGALPTPMEVAALLDCALAVRRCDTWMRSGPTEPPRRLVVLDIGPGGLDAALFKGSSDEASGYAPNAPDLAAAIAAALDAAEKKEARADE